MTLERYLVNGPQMDMGKNFCWRAWPYGPIWDAHPKTTAIDVKTGVLSGFDPQTLAIIFYIYIYIYTHIYVYIIINYTIYTYI